MRIQQEIRKFHVLIKNLLFLRKFFMKKTFFNASESEEGIIHHFNQSE